METREEAENLARSEEEGTASVWRVCRVYRWEELQALLNGCLILRGVDAAWLCERGGGGTGCAGRLRCMWKIQYSAISVGAQCAALLRGHNLPAELRPAAEGGECDELAGVRQVRTEGLLVRRERVEGGREECAERRAHSRGGWMDERTGSLLSEAVLEPFAALRVDEREWGCEVPAGAPGSLEADDTSLFLFFALIR